MSEIEKPSAIKRFIDIATGKGSVRFTTPDDEAAARNVIAERLVAALLPLIAAEVRSAEANARLDEALRWHRPHIVRDRLSTCPGCKRLEELENASTPKP